MIKNKCEQSHFSLEIQNDYQLDSTVKQVDISKDEPKHNPAIAVYHTVY